MIFASCPFHVTCNDNFAGRGVGVTALFALAALVVVGICIFAGRKNFSRKGKL